MINRIYRRGGFAQIPNSLLRDSRLSFKARGILCMIMSHSDEWVVSKSWLQAQGTEGRLAIDSAVAELRKFGYLHIEEKDPGEDGRFRKSIWSWYEEPIEPQQVESANQGESVVDSEQTPMSDNRMQVPATGNQHTQNTITEQGYEEHLPPDKPSGGEVTNPKPKPQRPRDELLEFMATLNGESFQEVTKNAIIAAATALSQIRAVMPDVGVDELKRRRCAYLKKFPGISLTPFALAKHWASLSIAATVATKPKRTGIPNL